MLLLTTMGPSPSLFDSFLYHIPHFQMTTDAALGHERYAEYLLLEEVNDPDEGLFHLKKALSLYEEWGAHQKCALLLKSHPQLASTAAGRTIIKLT